MNEALDLNSAAEKLAALRQPEPSSEDVRPVTEAPSSSQGDDSDDRASPEGLLEQPSETREPEAETKADEVTLDAEQLSHLLGIEQERIVVNDKGEVRFRTKVDGEEGDATLAEAIERYQRDANLTNRSKELAKLREQAQQKLNELVERSQTIAAQHTKLYQSLESEFMKPFAGIDWNSLRTEDPVEWAAKREEQRQAQDSFRRAFEESGKALNDEWQKTQKDIQERTSAYVTEQAEMVKKFVPGFNEESRGHIRSFLLSEGFSEQEVGNVTDARVVKLAHMAMQFSQGQKKVKESLKKPLPKVLKPGAKPSAQVGRTESLKKLHGQLRKTGSMLDAAALLRERFKE